MSQCPVDHQSRPPSQAECPVDHQGASSWSSLLPKNHLPIPSSSSTSSRLSDARETSSIPTATTGTNWQYPSEAQFFAAMARKKHNPQAQDMHTIVPIHNAVNERAWAEVAKWEGGRGGELCGGVKLINFKGNPGKLSPRARWKSLLGYSPPFDRHDWVVDRCGTKMRYVIDFYTGRSTNPGSTDVSFYLDVRPALDNWEAVKMRAGRFWGSWFSAFAASSPTSAGHEKSSS